MASTLHRSFSYLLILIFLPSLSFAFGVNHLGSILKPIDPNDPKYAWMDEVVEEEFLPYEEDGITKKMLDITEKLDLCNKCFDWGLVRYRVVDSIVYGPDGPAKSMLDYLVRVYTLPDLDIIYDEGDGYWNQEDFPGPVLTSAKRPHIKNAILYHDWYFHIERDNDNPFLNWATLWKQIELCSYHLPWEKKIDKAFWRGALNGFGPQELLPRATLCLLSAKHPELIDAGVAVKWDYFLKGINITKPYADHYEHVKYKYQLCLDGYTCTYPGYQWRLLSNCAVFKDETPDKMWFYSQLKPWVHYIPIKADMSDLIEKLNWAKAHDKEVKQIAKNSQEFARENLLPPHIALYCYKVLIKYASLQKFQPQPPKLSVVDSKN